MTTEQCSVDSVLSKSRTETFARQLQNRLRTLSSGEVDVLEDAGWNGEQLSSSSEDIYYDLDSYPGSPAEEATEVDFTNYINVKTAAGVYPSSTSNGYLQNKSSVQYENNLDYEHLGHCSKLGQNQINPTNCLNTLDNEFLCGHCSSATNNHVDDCFSLPNGRINHNKCNLNNSPEVNHSLTNQLDCTPIDENEYDINDHTFFLASQSINNLDSEVNEINGFNNRLHYNGRGNEYEDEEEEDEDTIWNQDDDQLTDCLCSSNLNKSFDVNRNSTTNDHQNYHENGTNVTIKVTPDCCEVTSNNGLETSLNYNKPCKDILNGNEPDLCIDSTVVENKEKYSKDDLNRLVEAVFLRSEEKDFNEEPCKDITVGVEKIALKVGDEIGETIESKRSKLRRCSSLKSGKTPPGTPGCKKIVRFADVLGLDLADVRTFLDEVPKVPRSAFNDLKNVELSCSPPVNMLHSFMGQDTTSIRTLKTIVPLFQQPSGLPEYIERIRNRFVCLENAVITDTMLSVITGVVRVKNIDYNKSVHVRYSFDNWKSFADLQATYISNSCDGFSDKFKFTLYAHMLNVGQRLEFAVRFHACGSVYWDNNYGANYAFQCVPEGPSKVLPTTSSYNPPSNPIEAWASFY